LRRRSFSRGERQHGHRVRGALMKSSELKLCGLAPVRARFARDAASIKRLYFDYPTGRKIGMMCKALSVAKKVYRCVDAAELEKISGTVHHGGIVAVVDAPALRAPGAAEMRQWAAARAPVLLLDRIGNAHNLGAIARTAGFFGVRRLVVADHPDAAMPGEAAYRVAEGGLEAVEIFRVRDLAGLVRDLRALGYTVVGAATRGGASLGRGRPLPASSAAAEPVAIVLGSEEQGLAPEVAAACTGQVSIPGSGAVESLNVSVAAAVLMWELLVRR
jgi:RNA methyltransferase, TrmH family